MLDVLPLIPYNLLMLYAMVCVASAWAWGQRRGIPDALLGLAGIAIPMAGWVFSVFFAWAGLLLPVTLGALWWWASRREEADDRVLREMHASDRAAATARLKDAPDDGAARLMIAQSLENEGRWAEALIQYEACHVASDRMLPEKALEAARERLSHALAVDQAPRGELLRGLALRRFAWTPFVIAAGLCLWSPGRGLAALSLLAFARWLRVASETRPGSRSF
ncbi:MAG: hypothetical protein A2506_06480 [Elusimicrobia bacterium RIFOXYD12_FULL_66_9]|nr:MAG: hypothetical protein A2506_06480 [Elusimicrobia bacterium RIFOXYD12_FULL_66_9]